MVNKRTFINQVAKKAGFTQGDVKDIADAMYAVICEDLLEEGEVKILDSITLVAKEVPARSGRNPQTGESIEIPEHRTVKAKFGKAIREILK